MRVRAKFANGRFGFYGDCRRRDGDEFYLTDPSHFSAKWMIKLEDDKEEKPRRGRRPAHVIDGSEEGAE